MPGRIVLLHTTHRVAPGLLSAAAWDELRAADAVLVRDADHPSLGPVAGAGVRPSVVGPLDDGALARLLIEAAVRGNVVLLGGADGDPGLAPALAEALASAAMPPEVEVLPGSWDLPGARLLDLVAVMDRLRSPGGCPWDASQTHGSLLPYLVEEAHEVLEAIETGDSADLREELGDLLLQVVFHARLGEEAEEEPWSIDDVAAGIVDKLVRRHPHVFAPADHREQGRTAEQVEAGWHVAKAVEKGRTSVLDGVPRSLPALTLAASLLARAERGGVAVHVPASPVPVGSAAELGETLLALVAQARSAGIDAEAALRQALREWSSRVRAQEAGSGGAGPLPAGHVGGKGPG